jgi:NAD(P)-dependent dehydrogenase (short-subunit alcohol dehydrogenase family)
LCKRARRSARRGGGVTESTSPVALVTGASSGIGAACARALARRGTTVVGVARRADRLATVLDECRGDAPMSLAVSCDLSDTEAARRVVTDTIERFGRLDALVLNAGMPMRRRVQELEERQVRAVLELNYLSPVAMALEAIPHLVGKRRGTIVFVSSLVGRLGNGGEAAYCASKFAICGFAEAASVDLAGTGVEIRLVLPGPIDTEMWREHEGQDAPAYDGELFAPELVADAVVEALSGPIVEHYVPDLKSIVEMKTADFQGFRDAMVAALRGEVPVQLPDEQ